MKEVARTAGLEAKSAGLLNGSGALVTLLQLLPEKHSKQHCVAVANAQLCSEATADVQTLEAALLLKELQVTKRASGDSGRLRIIARIWGGHHGVPKLGPKVKAFLSLKSFR